MDKLVEWVITTIVLVLMVLLFVVVMALAALWEGYVLSVLWGWFIVPQFGLSPLPILLAIGLALTVGLLTKQYVPHNDNDHMIYVYLAVKPLLFLAAGWILLRFM